MATKNVEEHLMKEKTFQRKPGVVPYPVAHSNCLSNLDIWDSMFFANCCESLTMHEFERPPSTVLDLGCGTGFWAIEAAKQWANSTIVGYDFRKIQPRLFALPQYKDIAQRVRWVHGNFLDGLDFPSARFDFVRMVNVGLGVPEDEWQYVLEEVARVMKSGAILEIVEEDPIFPAESPPSQIRGKPYLPPISVNIPYSESTPSSAPSNRSSATLTSEQWSATLDERFDLHSSDLRPTRSTFSLASTTTAITSPNPTSPRSPLSPSSSTNYIRRSSTSTIGAERTSDPRDHSKLKEAWDAMLSERFLATGLLSVLPFYISSLSFAMVKARPPLKVPLPPPYPTLSMMQPLSIETSSCKHEKPDGTCERKSYLSRRSTLSSTSSASSEPDCSTWPTMHLAKTVKTIIGCKEAIWNEYKKRHTGGMIAQISRPGKIEVQASSPREAFESEWTSWESDMAGRIGMRDTIFSQLSWIGPPAERSKQRISQNTFTFDELRTSSKSFSSGSSISSGSESSVPLCRSIGGFIARKL